MERQKHGFDIEKRVIDLCQLTSAAEAGIRRAYTAAWDAYTGTGIPVSIKTKTVSKKQFEKLKNNPGASNGPELGDFSRMINIDQEFIMVVVYVERGNNTNVLGNFVLHFTAKEWKLEVFNGHEDDIRSILDRSLYLLKIISNNRSDDLIWKSSVAEIKKLYGDQLLRLAFKRDHKTQKRLQCSISGR